MGRSVYVLVRRILLLWTFEVLALWLMARVLPGLRLDGWDAAILGVAVIALLNALVRPLLLLLTLPFTVFTFGLLTLVLNGIVLWLATLAVPHLHLDNFGTGVIAALGLTLTNTLAAYVFAFNEEESVYRNVMRRISSRGHDDDGPLNPGLILIEFDGLSATLLERAVAGGYMPTLRRWIETEGYSLSRWDCGVPSQTSSSQAGILFGNNFDIPGFRWFEKSSGQMIVSNDPGKAMRIEERVSSGQGLLHGGGVSVCNMFTGDAERSIATISAFSHPARQVRRASPLYFSFYLSPYNFTRALSLVVREFVVEWLESIRQRLRGVTPRVSRGGLFPLLRAMSTVATRELGTFIVIHEMFASVPVAYITYVGYDVVAHHAGPEAEDALSVLRYLDRRVAMIERSSRDAPRPYRFVVLSDHGQTRSTPFRHRYGATVDEVVRDLLSGDRTVHAPVIRTEGWGHLNAFLTEAIRHDRVSGRAARRLLRRKTHEGTVALGRESEPGDASVVVCNSGNLSNIYFRENPERMSLEEIADAHPGLIEGLVSHDGIAFAVVHSSQHGPVALGKNGLHHLNTGRVDGEDPLTGYGAHAASQLARLAAFPHCGDIVLNGRYDTSTGLVITFEEMVGTHGGLGGPQTEGFVLHPSHWPMSDGAITNAEALHGIFSRWREELAAGREPGAGRVDGGRPDGV